MNKEQAESLMDRIIKQLFYRDCRGFARVSISDYDLNYPLDFHSIVSVL